MSLQAVSQGFEFEIAEIQKIFPVTPRDRRENFDLFSSFIERGDIRDNDKFYRCLATILRDNPSTIRDYDLRMDTKRQRHKTFAFRTWRHLQQVFDEPIKFEEVLDLPSDRFDGHPFEAALVELFRGLIESPTAEALDDREETPEATSNEEEEAQDWQELVAGIVHAAEALTTPDLQAVERIVELANRLSAACKIAVVATAAMDLANVQQSLITRISLLEPLLREKARAVILGAVQEELDEIESLIDAAEIAVGRQQEAISDWEVIRRQSAEANETDDLDRYDQLLPLRRASQSKRDIAVAAAAEALTHLRGAFDNSKSSNTMIETSRSPTPEIDDGTAPDKVATQDDPPALPPKSSLEGLTSPNVASQIVTSGSEYAFAPKSQEEPSAYEIGSEILPKQEPAPSRLEVERAAPSGVRERQEHDPDIEELLAHYLKIGEPALAWHLSSLAEEQSARTVTLAPLLEAVAVAPSFSRPDDMADPSKLEILSAATSALATIESNADERYVEFARALMLAALLRPALFDMNNVARSNLARIALDGRLTRYAPLVSGLSNLGFEIRLSVEDLARFAGTEQKKRLPEATAAVARWLSTTRTRKTVHQPTYRILHWQLAPQGELGQVFEGVLADAPDAGQKAEALVERLLHNRVAQEEFVAESENKTGRPRRSRIEGMALDWFCERLQEGSLRLREWLDAGTADQDRSKDRQFESFAARLGNLRKLAAEAGNPATTDQDVLLLAAQETLARAIANISDLLEGRASVAPTPTIRALVQEPLLRFPGGCQPYWETGVAFADERTAQRKKLYAALCRPELLDSDYRIAFGRRLAEGATLAARSLLEALKLQGMEQREAAQKQQALDETISATRLSQRDRVERLRQDLATLINLELGEPEKIRAELDRIDFTANALGMPLEADGITLPAIGGLRQPEVPPDFPELDGEIHRIASFRDALRESIREDQRDRLATLPGDPETKACRQFISDRMESLDPVTVDDMIADLQAGRTPTIIDDNREDDFTRFYPTMAAKLSEDGEINRGRVLRAIEEGGSVGSLNFGQHDEYEIAAAKRLVETWGEADNGLRQGSVQKMRDAMERLFGALGFTGMQIVNGRELVPARLRSLQLGCDVPKADHWFLPPVFGSEAGGIYQVLVARAEVAPDQLSSELGRLAPDHASILIVFGKLGPRRREALARVLRRDRRPVLFIDESLLLFLAASRGNIMERLFNCAMPFGWMQPYTTNPGMIPPEMFFGRRAEMAKIVARSANGCLVYGGRQLGKSALLNHIRRQFHRPENGQIALYLDIKPIGDIAIGAEHIWSELANVLHQEKIIADRRNDPQLIEAAVRQWLQGKPDRRLLIMLDEADRFLRSEHAAVYPNLQRLKSLMESTNWRFKVVFAGLHNVRRMAQAPNSPLVHFGDAICIGPMNAGTDNQSEARRLAVAPMLAAGLEYDPPSLAWDMLARMNHYPSLVQVFCKSIIETADSQARPVGEGPRWKLSRETLFEGRTAQLIGAEIRKRFQWTLDLDPRYDLLAKCIALYRFDGEDGHSAVLRRGLSAQEIGDLVAPWWPQGLERAAIGDLEELLREMVDLGVLGMLGPGRYGLRNAHIAQMLGQEADIQRDILSLSEREPDVDYDAATFHRRVGASEGMPRSPLPDRALKELFSFRPPAIRLIGSSAAIVGHKIAERLVLLAQSWSSIADIDAKVVHHKAGPTELRLQIENAKRGHYVIITECRWDQKVADWIGKQGSILSGRVILIWIVPVKLAVSADVERANVVLFRPGAWTESMLRHWLREEGLNALDNRATRKAVLEASGGAPERLLRMRALLQELTSDNIERRADRLQQWREANPVRPADVGLLPELQRALSEIASFGGSMEHGDLVELLGEDGVRLGQVMEPLGLAEATGSGGLQLTPLGRLLAE